VADIANAIVGFGDDGKLDLGVVPIDQLGRLRPVICAKDVADITIL